MRNMYTIIAERKVTMKNVRATTETKSLFRLKTSRNSVRELISLA